MPDAANGSHIDEDGLPKVKVNTHTFPNFVAWPFDGSHHRGWHPDPERRNIWAYVINEKHPCCDPPKTDIHRLFQDANIEKSKYTDSALDLALRLFQEAMDKPVSARFIHEDNMLRSFSMTNVGILLAVRIPPKAQTYTPTRKCFQYFFHFSLSLLCLLLPGAMPLPPPGLPPPASVLNRDNYIRSEREAVLLFKIGALGYKLPQCKYLYGHALIHGTGGIKKDIPKGMAFLHDAGSVLIAEALFELGSIYERGCMENLKEGITKDYAMALDFYEAARQASTDTDQKLRENAWTPQILLTKRLLRIDNIHLQEDTVQNAAGLQFAWTILGHSFLFSATASLASTVQPNHYAPLLILIPILGILLAGYSIDHTFDTYRFMQRNQELVQGMLCSKYAAYKAIINNIVISLNLPKEDAPTNPIYCLAIEEQDEVAKQEKCINERFRRHGKLGRSLILISGLFYLIWLILLIFEVKSKMSGCSYWNKSPCMLCNADSKADHENFLCMAAG